MNAAEDSTPPEPPPLPSVRPARSRWMRRRIVYPLTYTLFFIASFMFHLADRLLLIPSTTPVAVRIARQQFIDHPRGKIETYVTRSKLAANATTAPAKPAAYVLEFTGNATRAEEITESTARDYRPHDVEVWTINYPGYGQSDGPARLASIADAALAAFDQMQKVAGEVPIFIHGESLGTTAALHVAANRSPAGLVLINPPPLRDLILRRHGWWNLWLVAVPVAIDIPARLDSLRNAPRCQMPAVFLTSGQDQVVPHRFQQKVVDAYAGPKRVIFRADANHNMPNGSAEQIELQNAISWLLAQPR